jgi:tetratricopeptide (TPR) repeat protein
LIDQEKSILHNKLRLLEFTWKDLEVLRQIFIIMEWRCNRGKFFKSIRVAMAIVTILFLNWFPFENFALAESKKNLGGAEHEEPFKRIELLDELLQEQGLTPQKLGSLYFQRALAFKEIKDYFRALEDLDIAMSHTKRLHDVLLEKSECLIMVDQLDQASLALENFLLTRPGTARAYTLKGMVYERTGAYFKAEDEYTRALLYDPGFFPALEARANVFLKEGKPRKALEDLDILTNLNPERADGFILRADVYSKMGNYPAALADYTKAEDLRPDDEKLRRKRVIIYLKINRPEKALELLSKFHDKQDDIETFLLSARAHILLKNWKDVKSILGQVDRKWPNNAEARLLRGVLNSREGNLDDSLTNLNAAIELDAKLVEAYKERARVLIKLKEYVRAVNDLTAACEVDPADVEIYTLRSEVQYQRRMYNAAEIDIDRALETLPDDPRVIYNKALIYLRTADFEKACKELDRILKLKPDQARSLSMRGVARFFLGDLEKAVHDFEKSVSLAPVDPLILNNRGFFYFKVGNFSAAKADFETALNFSPSFVDARQNLDLVGSRQSEGNFILSPEQEGANGTK